MSATGLSVTAFAVQYSNASAAEIAASPYDLVIVEARPLAPGASDLSDAEVASLMSQGKVISGYVSLGQTDESRPYWDAVWTDPTGLPVGEGDTGPLQPGAPDWILEVADSWPARIVDTGSADWRAIVIAQVEDMAARGFGAVFLDNILTYYELAAQRGELGTAQSQHYAQEMMQLVIDVAAAARAINPGFAIIANGGPYIIGDAGAFGTQLAVDYLDAVDAIMAESFFGLLNGLRDDTTLDVYESFWAAQGIDVLALEYSTDPEAIAAFAAEAEARGFAASVSPDQALNVLPDPIEAAPKDIEGTPGPDDLSGTDDADVIRGFGGSDDLSGGAGADDIYGGRGLDQLFGGSGGDRLWGQRDADALSGGTGADQLFGGGGADLLKGDNGADLLAGGKGSDRLFGGLKDDLLRGGTAADVLGGGRGRDALFGGGGKDLLRGGLGDDTLNGGTGADDLFGGAGRDTFQFNAYSDDYIGDFEVGVDTLLLVDGLRYHAERVDGGAQILASNGASIELEGLTLGEARGLIDDAGF